MGIPARVAVTPQGVPQLPQQQPTQSLLINRPPGVPGHPTTIPIPTTAAPSPPTPTPIGMMMNLNVGRSPVTAPMGYVHKVTILPKRLFLKRKSWKITYYGLELRENSNFN